MNGSEEQPLTPEQTTDSQRLVTIKAAASLLGCSEANVYALKDAGLLPFVTIGVRKGYRIDLKDLDAFIARRKTEEVAAPVKLPRPRLKHLRLPR
ncbi:MAG: helix-turn-helix domain-containing protein [Planctomycetaceae bacterium]|nr:helix-turn-helix domain-containing protein [Planctomycetaceae bacterium]